VTEIFALVGIPAKTISRGNSSDMSRDPVIERRIASTEIAKPAKG